MMEERAEERDSALERVLARHPHLKDRTLFDLVNGLEVASDLVRVGKRPQGLGTRIWKSINGHAAREQWLLDSSLTTTVAGAVDWLKVLEARQIRSDISLSRVATFACDLREVVDAEGARVRSELVRIETQFTEWGRGVSIRIDSLEASRSAQTEFAKIADEDGEYAAYRGLTWMLPVLDTLMWGKVGAYLRGGANGEDKREVAEGVARGMANLMRGRLGLQKDVLLTVGELLDNIDASDPLNGQTLSYMAYGGSEFGIIEAIAARAEGRSLASAGRFPEAATPRGFSIRFVKEGLRRWAPGQEHLSYKSERYDDE